MRPPTSAFALIALLVALTPAFGEALPKHTCRILFLDGPDSAPDTLHLFDGASSIEVRLPRMSFSEVHELRPGSLDLFMLPGPLDDPAALPAGAPAVKVPEDLVDFYLLVTSDPANAVAPVRMQVIPADPGRFKRGQMLWFNLTDKMVGGKVGSRKLLINPKTRLILDPPANEATDYPVDLAYRLNGREGSYPLCETRWLHDPRSRTVAFIVAREGARTPRVLVFPDYREQEKEE